MPDPVDPNVLLILRVLEANSEVLLLIASQLGLLPEATAQLQQKTAALKAALDAQTPH